MTTFPTIPASQWVQRLEHPGRKIRLVLDTDAFNEIDDPFATLTRPSALVHSPRISEDFRWMHDPFRHMIRCVHFIRRDEVFRDLFLRIAR
ncbi:hypothetical protein SAMN04488688_102693 [Paenibacillus sp. cl141a]|uniref:hypothetical protein n=1 Tax=Paenibacillus sp. cl141a TaxID=1761877 RepID=UPI0008B3E5D5|nr:hypothetical protein [Paenibacillus sp. cl141a]SEK94187.1 hypothetical protein SAMN04488688_102693 [Paenibacillus sp. cl141a]